MSREHVDSQPAKGRAGGVSLAVKLNVIIVAAILLVSAGLVTIGYRAHSKRMDAVYLDRLQDACENGAFFVDPEGLAFFWECISSDEYARVHQQAIEADDEQFIIDWMKEVDASQVGADEDKSQADGAPLQHLSAEYSSLYDVYNHHAVLLDSFRNSAGITSAYIQFMKDGVTYDLIDPDLSALDVGVIEDPLPEFAEYGDNEMIPPTIYKSKFGWLCTTADPIVDEDSGEAVAMLCFDADMNETMAERTDFLMGTIAYVLFVTLLTLFACLYLVRRIVTDPLRQLTDATCGFCEGGQELDKNETIELDIHSNDEIGALYNEIRLMQGRIVDYTDNMTRITAEKERAKTELEMANNIQESMLPGIFPAYPHRKEFNIYASMDPAKDVGGDFFDFFLIDDDHLALVIADVSGKGVPAALFMMAAKIMIDDRAMMAISPAEIMTSVNAKICETNRTKTFVTVWLGILDIRTGTLTCTNAGHNYPWVRGADGMFKMLRDKHGLVVGGSKRSRYKDYTIDLEPGDAIFVYTDGINEAVNPEHEFFGLDRLGEALNSADSSAPEDVLQSVRTSVDEFVYGAEQFDDMTMLCMEYLGRQQETDVSKEVVSQATTESGTDQPPSSRMN